MNKYNLLTYILPTNNPDEFFNKFGKSLSVFYDIKDYISFCINFQSPWTQDLIDRALKLFEAVGLFVYHTFNKYEKKEDQFPLMEMRNDALRLNPKCKYFAFIDDDIVYSCSKEEYASVIIQCIEYMNFYNVGSLTIGQPVYKAHWDPWDDKIVPMRKDLHTNTALGTIFNNIYGGNILPEEMVDLYGSGEDRLLGEYRLYISGYNIAQARCQIGFHLDIKATKDKSVYKYNLLKNREKPHNCGRYSDELGKKYNDVASVCPEYKVDKKLKNLSFRLASLKRFL